jgi:hypothetical protein
VNPGKGPEYEAFLRDVSLPLARARGDAGEFAWFLAATSVVPAGTSAPCDYRLVYGYKGDPPEAVSKETIAAALKRANLKMTYDEMVARRNALTQLVSVEIWVQMDGIGASAEKDSYVHLNHYKVKTGEDSEWLRLETTYWKPLMDAWLKSGGKGGWGVHRLWLPNGDAIAYNAMTVDVFPSWKALVSGVPVGELWTKVHPNTTTSALFDRLEKVRSTHDSQVYKVVDAVRGK